VAIQIIFWLIGGIGVLSLAVADTFCRRDSRSWLLTLWVLGTFLFAAGFNWTVNARSLLPLAPPVGILLVRRLEKNHPKGETFPWRRVTSFLAGAAALTLMLAGEDFRLATAVRESARQACAKYGREENPLWFQGHWGFQYYMEAAGASALDMECNTLRAGDTVAIPLNNTNLSPPEEQSNVRDILVVPGPRWVTTWNNIAGAGFYSSVWGSLPFVLGRAPPEIVVIYPWRQPLPAQPGN
jgi:hypothetical protein